MDSPITGTGTTTLTPGEEGAAEVAAMGVAGAVTGAADEDAVEVAALLDVSMTYRSLPTAI